MGNLRLDWLKFIFQALDEIKLNNQKKKKKTEQKKSFRKNIRYESGSTKWPRIVP